MNKPRASRGRDKCVSFCLRALLALSIVCGFGLGAALAQSTDISEPVLVSRDLRALALANQSLQATASSVAPDDITLQGTVSYTAGSDFQSGTVVLEARGNGKSRVVLNLDGGPQQEVRNGPLGHWTDSEGTQHPMATHNCWTDAPWFFPSLSLQALATDPEVSITYAGLETREGVTLHHLRLFRTVPKQTPKITADIQRLSTMDLYLDAASYLPLVLTFNIHPDDDLNQDIPVEVQFGDHRLVNGVRVPFRIQKFLQGSLLLDIAVSGATINSGLHENLFAVEAR